MPNEKPKQQHSCISLNEVERPAELFYTPQARQSDISPAASFKPVEALQDSLLAWGSSTSPLMAPRQKTIIISKDYFDACENIGHCIAFLCWLRLNEFEICLCLKNDRNDDSKNRPLAKLRKI
jgi:hypothetical protein